MTEKQVEHLYMQRVSRLSNKQILFKFQDLIDDLRDELSGDFRESVMACFVKPAIFDAWSVKEAIYVSISSWMRIFTNITLANRPQVVEFVFIEH